MHESVVPALAGAIGDQTSPVAKARAVASSQAGLIALSALAVASWCLIVLARTGQFWLSAIALMPLALAAGFGLYLWWRSRWRDRLVVVAIVGAGALLFTPPGEHIPLFGDAAIYPNAGGLLARTGSLVTTYDVLAPLPANARALFYVPYEDQKLHLASKPYEGLVYWAYYLTDSSRLSLVDSRQPLVEAWFGLLIKSLGVRPALFGTGAFAILSLILLFGVGREVFGWAAGVWAVVLLAVSYPQVYYGRAPYAEIFGQFWMLAGLYPIVLWLKHPRPWLLPVALFLWTTAWAARGEAVLLLAPFSLVLIYAALRHDKRSLVASLAALPFAICLGWLGTNPAYSGAEYMIFAADLPWLPKILQGSLILLIAGGVVGWLYGPQLLALGPRVIRLGGLAGVAVAAVVVLWATLPNPLRVAGSTRPYEELVWFASLYMTPVFFWLALAGAAWIFAEARRPAPVLVATTGLLFAAALFFKHTTAPIYPVALRRQVSEVYPLMALLAGAALGAVRLRRPWRSAQWAIGVITVIWLLALSWPVIWQHEAAGSVAVVEEMHGRLPAGSVAIFEQQGAQSWIGWLAAPLYSLYGDNVLLLHSDNPDTQLLGQAVGIYKQAGKEIYLISQHKPLPLALLPAGYQAVLVDQGRWRSTMIGHTRSPYPPPYWEYDHPIYTYKLE
jgi:hypothetical protein